MGIATMVTLAKGGEGENIVLANAVHIPDLWHIAETIQSRSPIEKPEACAAMILECWHLAHDFKRHIIEETP